VLCYFYEKYTSPKALYTDLQQKKEEKMADCRIFRYIRKLYHKYLENKRYPHFFK